MNDTAACPIRPRSLSLGESVGVLVRLKKGVWIKAVGLAVTAAVIIGLPTRLIPNSIFVRMIATSWIDYAIFTVSVCLIGLTWALPRPQARRDGNSPSLLGGLGTLMAVGCPTCNKLVVLLLGSSGALSYFAPLQPILGVAAIALVIFALLRRLGEVAVMLR